jgi:uncharacterized membrane protein HdeD (DUF308 family)
MTDRTQTDGQWIFDLLPLILIISGLILNWMELDERALVTYIGFTSYGVLGLIELLKVKKVKRQLLRLLKIVALVLVIFISIISILGNPTYFIALLALVLLDRIILTIPRLEPE